MRLQLSYVPLLGLAAHVAAVDLDAMFGPYVSADTVIASSCDADYASVLGPRWSTWAAPTYFGAIMPATEADLQAIVRVAKMNNVPFHATTRGHGTNLQYGKIRNALNINLGNFRSVSVDADNNRLTIGGATPFGDVFPSVWAAGKEIPTGNAKCVGMVGATISGGIGSMMGMHGPIADSLLSVRMVTASGKVVTASETENSDLFWGIRGAGANFGIITSATYRLYDQTANGQGIMATFVFPASANRSVWELVRSYDDSLPRPLSVLPQMAYNRTSNKPIIVYAITYIGSLADAQPHIDKALALGPVSSSVIDDTVPVMNNALSGGACTNGLHQRIHTIGLNRTDVDTFEDVFSDMATFYEANPEYNGRVIFQRYSNEVALQTPVSTTSFAWRDIKTYLLLFSIYSSPALDKAVGTMAASVRAKLQATSGFATPHVYLNYDQGDEGPAAWWGPNLDRLRALKAKWDPKNLFGKGAPMK